MPAVLRIKSRERWLNTSTIDLFLLVFHTPTISFWPNTLKKSKNITTKITPPKLYFPNENLLHTAIVVYIYQWNISAVVGFATYEIHNFDKVALGLQR